VKFEDEEGNDCTFVESVRVVCPFCGLTAHVGHVISCGIAPEPCVTHEMPPCEKYREMDMADYVKACRERLSN
jgi:hypothetical protein